MTIASSSNFTVFDIRGALQAAVAFAAILLAPGYLLGVATDLFRFRTRSLPERGAWSVALSFCTVPVYVALTGRMLSLQTVAVTFGMAAVIALVFLAADWRRLAVPWTRATLLLAAFVLLGSALVMGELVDIQRGDALHLSVTVLDQSYRVAFTDAIARTGIPPSNPLYHPGAAAPLRYYYFWYAVCAVCMKLAHVTARQALIASSIWSGIGLLAAIALFARHFLRIGQGLHRFILTAALLLAVTGADILPTLFNLLASHIFDGDLEWWSIDQVSSWLDTILWVPNHLAAMICCVTAFLLLWRSQEQPARKHLVAAMLLAAAGAASSLGLSVYVAAGFALLMLAFAVRLGSQRQWNFIGLIAGAAFASVLLSVPYLREMAGGHSAVQEGSTASPLHMFQFSVRQMIDPDLVTGLPAFGAIERAHPVLLDQAVRLVLLLPGYALELGFFAAVLVLAVRERKRLDEPRRTALFLALAGLLLVGFVRSSVIHNNDFGYRAALFPCFFLLLLGADRLRIRRAEARSPARHQSIGRQVETLALTTLMVVGVAGTIFQAAALRLYLPLRASQHVPGFAELPGNAFAARTAYDAAALPPGSIVQANPSSLSQYGYLVNMLYAQRASATDGAPECGAVFGGDPGPCPRLRAELIALFDSHDVGAASAIATCREFGIGYLAVRSGDPAWSNPEGWVWTLPLVAGDRELRGGSAHGFRILNCAAVIFSRRGDGMERNPSGSRRWR